MAVPLADHARRILGNVLNVRRLVLGAVIVIVVGLVVYPVVMVITASFSPRESLGIATVAQKWYSGYAAVRANLRPILNSVVIATGSTLLALVFGTGLAWITARTNVPFSVRPGTL